MAGTHTRVHDRSLGWPVLSRFTGELARVSSEQMAIQRVEEAGEGMEESPEAKFRLWGWWGGRQGQGRTDRPPGTLSPGPGISCSRDRAEAGCVRSPRLSSLVRRLQAAPPPASGSDSEADLLSQQSRTGAQMWKEKKRKRKSLLWRIQNNIPELCQ